MKRFLLLLAFVCALFCYSCQNDIGTIKVTYQEATAVYGNLDEIRNQSLITSTQSIVDPGKVYVANDYILIGEEEKGIHVIENTDVNNPSNVAFINIPGNREFFVKDDVLYAESYYDVLKIDISNPLQANLLNRATNVFQSPITNDMTGETLIGFSFEEITKEVDEQSDLYNELIDDNIVYYDFAQNIIPKSAVPSSFSGNSNNNSGTVNRIAHANEHVYIISSDKLFIINDDASFTKVSSDNYNFEVSEMETIFPHEGHLFIGSRSSMEIFDISVADDPKHIYNFDHATSCDPVLPTGEVAYVTLRTADFSECPGDINALIVLDIKDLSQTQLHKEIAMNSPYGMNYFDGKLFVGEGDNGLKIFDASDKLNPQLVFHDATIRAYDILPHPNSSSIILIAGPDGIQQYEQNNGQQLVLKSSINF